MSSENEKSATFAHAAEIFADAAGPRTPEELQALVARMREVAARTYALFFRSGMGGEVHAFIEINGLISKYVDMCQAMADEGIDFTASNIHTGRSVPMQVHDAIYLADKIACMFGPMLHGNPEALAAFKRKLGL